MKKVYWDITVVSVAKEMDNYFADKNTSELDLGKKMRELLEITERSGDAGSGKTDWIYTNTCSEEEGVTASLLSL